MIICRGVHEMRVGKMDRGKVLDNFIPS